MSVLDELGIKHNTDKASLDRMREPSADLSKRPPGHNYLIKYEHFLRHLTHKSNITILELGAGPDWNIGASAYMWADYFPACNQIHIAEIRPSSKKIKTDRIHPRIGDLSNPRFLEELGETQWDFIIDDASHVWEHQKLALATLISSVKNGGIYVIEDIHTSFGKFRGRYCSSSIAIKRKNARLAKNKSSWYKKFMQRLLGALQITFLKLKVLLNYRYAADAMIILSEIACCVAGKNKFHPILKSSKDSRLVTEISEQIQSITFVEGSAILVKKSTKNTYLS